MMMKVPKKDMMMVIVMTMMMMTNIALTKVAMAKMQASLMLNTATIHGDNVGTAANVMSMLGL